MPGSDKVARGKCCGGTTVDVPWEFRRGKCFRLAEVMGKRSEKARWKKQTLKRHVWKDGYDS